MPSSYSLGEHFEQFVQEQLGTGQYASASEVIRDALRLLEDHKAGTAGEARSPASRDPKGHRQRRQPPC